MANNQYYIGANDEHGVNPPTAGKRTPIMPYLNRPIYENEFNRGAKNAFIAALLRNGFRVFDVKPEQHDIPISTRVARINAQRLTLCYTFAYNAFGSGINFNSANGVEVFYSLQNPYSDRSRMLAEETYIQLVQGTPQTGRGVKTLTGVGVLSSVNCVSALAECGFMTNLYEAKLMLDWDFLTEVGEECCNGVCSYLGVPYLPRMLSNYPLLRRGNSGDAVLQLQFLLFNYGYSIDIDGVFGSATQSAVIAYQKDNGLSQDGIVGSQTWKTLLFMPPFATVRLGSRGTYVKYLQSKLESKLYPVGTIDGIFGQRTLTSVIEFQSENGLTADGIVGPVTWSAVSRIGGGRSPQEYSQSTSFTF